MATLHALKILESDKQYVERQLADAQDDPWGTTLAMWRSRLAEINRQIKTLAAASSSYASVALIFEGNPVISSTDIRVDFTTDALTTFQKLIAARLAEQERQAAGDPGALPKRGRLPGRRNSNLYIRDLVRGSMGFVLEERVEQAELLPTKLKAAVESTTELLDRLNSAGDDEFQRIVAESEPRVVQAIQKFTKVLFEAGASTRIAGDQNQLTMGISDVDRLSKRLNEVEITESVETVDGVLQGLLPEKLEFEFKVAGDEGPTIRGDVAEELANKYTLDPAFVERLLHKPGRARIKVVRTSRNGMQTKEQLIMEALEWAASSFATP
ncbi:hypothetical protein SAMN05216304_102738 [Bosea sp. OK403]|uniref:hypothetical protein n=1 Tax=Bosea sp. OK403 TaxID=1855286 RepID=UPI0008ED90BC|nr:hypothetical protein [Bosea sp. OK403]SFI43495.1 hypothetical protein SAMN05216304_102738 [Bosea sp. OK403]